MFMHIPLRLTGTATCSLVEKEWHIFLYALSLLEGV